MDSQARMDKFQEAFPEFTYDELMSAVYHIFRIREKDVTDYEKQVVSCSVTEKKLIFAEQLVQAIHLESQAYAIYCELRNAKKN